MKLIKKILIILLWIIAVFIIGFIFSIFLGWIEVVG